MVFCGTPSDKCTGGTVKVSHAQVSRITKAHALNSEAFTCYVNYMLSQGWKRIGSREFVNSYDGPIRVLSKPGKYGMRLRKGKEGRWEPYNLHAPIIA